jgi:hypothetical protein
MTGTHNELADVLIGLLKSVVYRDQSPALWREIVNRQGPARDHLQLLGLDIVIDDAEGYAYVRQIDTGDDDSTSVRRLIPRRQLSYPVSLLLVLLRKRLLQHDARGGETRLVLTRQQIVELMRTYMTVSSNEARIEDQIDRHIDRVEQLGFLRRMKETEEGFEVRRILRAFVNADWLSDLEALYREHAHRNT